MTLSPQRSPLAKNPSRWPLALSLAALLAAWAVSWPASAGNNLGFSISVDGEHVAGDDLPAPEHVPVEQSDETDIQLKFDGLGVAPVLNVSTVGARQRFAPGEAVPFIINTNYPSWIVRGEIRIRPQDGGDLVVVPVGGDGRAAWTMPSNAGDGFDYVLRVYDDGGRFDETMPLPLVRSGEDTTASSSSGVVAPGQDEDRAAMRSIPVFGGAVTVYGKQVPRDAGVLAFGEAVPVDAAGAFVIQRILPPGDHTVDVAVGSGDDAFLFSRSINIPDQEWFYVGMADLTIGKRFGSGQMVAANPSEFDSVYTKGHLAFYLKGKIRGEYLITAAANTGEDSLDQLFTGLDSKDPRQVLRRIDPDQFYPVYGDDSTLVDDAPTSGKFYIRLDRGESHVMWGNFKTQIGGTELLNVERSLYGASVEYNSGQQTPFGAERLNVTAYAAKPGTLPQRDILRGTGGSVYFLKRQDLTVGSETLTVELRDPATGLISTRRTLSRGKDYEIDYLQGIVILNGPLNSSASSGGVVREGALGDREVHLVVQYEYTPTFDAVEGYALGGRAEAWLTDHVAVGVTGISETTGLADQQLIGADVTLRMTEATFLEAELAQSTGVGFGQWVSTDGGLTFINQPDAGVVGRPAMAYHVKGQIDLADVTGGQVTGLMGAFYDSKQAGFSTIDQQTKFDQVVWGSFAQLEVTDTTTISARYEGFTKGDGQARNEVSAEVSYEFAPQWTIGAGLLHVDATSTGGGPQANGYRTDGGLELTYRPNDDTEIYGFAQATLAHSAGFTRNDRAGVGGTFQLTEHVGLNGEISYGTTGVGALAAVSYDPNADEHYYFGYQVNPDQGGDLDYSLSQLSDSGVVIGARRRFSEVVSVYAENNYGLFDRRRSLTSTYGVTLTPDALWTIDGGLEVGQIVDANAADFDRKAISVGVAYDDDEILAGHIRAEARLEDSDDDTRDYQSYLLDAGLSLKTSDDWRLLASLQGVISRSDQAAILDGDYIEGSIGYAYRPVDSDRLNLLFKYVLLYDLPGPDQVTASGSMLGPKQRSHILSVDAIYDINEFLTVGAKYGFRIGQVSATRDSDDFVQNSAHLGVVRADVHVLKDWDLLLEGRVLYSPEAMTTDYGLLTGISHDFGNNVRLGLGYNFGLFSDDLRDLTFDDQGVYLNVLGKF